MQEIRGRLERRYGLEKLPPGTETGTFTSCIGQNRNGSKEDRKGREELGSENRGHQKNQGRENRGKIGVNSKGPVAQIKINQNKSK